MRPLLLVGCLCAAGALLTGCGDGGGAADDQPAAGCGDDVRERIDPDHLVHVLPGAPEPEYVTDPPTSGPHAPSAAAGGVLDAPLSRPDQVGQLEAGLVLIQYGDLPDDDRVALEGLAADHDDVLVAPNDELPAPIVATAWTQKLECTSIDDGGLAALGAFADAHAGTGPGSDASGG